MKYKLKIIYLLIFAILIIPIIYLKINSKLTTTFAIDNNITLGTITNLSNKEIQQQLNDETEIAMFNVFMNTTPVFENGTVKGNLMIQNIESNHKPLQVDILRNDTHELIYKSGIIQPGYKIEEAELDKALEKGDYECTAYFNVLDKDAKKVISTVGLKVQITIEN